MKQKEVSMRKSSLRIISLMLCVIFAVCSCTTVNPYTQEKQASKLAIGAGIGAASGALIGALTSKSKNRRKNALLGAGIGALAGGSVGYYMDVQEAKLRQQLGNSGVSVTRQGDQIVLNMPGNITFEFGSANINNKFYDVLSSISVVLKKYEKTYVDVIGHTDSVGADAYNQTLSENRSRSVASYFAGQGIMAQRLLTAGRGETQPIATNDSAEGRALNRRVEIHLTPVTQ